MVTLNYKPLSVNKVWRGRRFKTNEYKQYEKDLLMLLPNIVMPEPPYKMYYEFGFSSAASDLDNPIKPLTDILQKRYNFDDKHIHELTAKKFKVKKGDDYLRFSITSLK